jgi:arylsulfatase A-like enzyme
MPTLLELAGLPVPQGIQGKSLLPSIRQGMQQDGMAFSVLRHRMVTTAEWKLIDPYQSKGEKPQLYHLTRDPDEQNNLYGKSEAEAAQARLESALAQWWAEKPPAVRLPE